MRHSPARPGRPAAHGTTRRQPDPPTRPGVRAQRRIDRRDMTAFEPIAVVGRGCVLPGALHPDQFWDNIVHGRVSLRTISPDDWRMPPHSLTTATAGLVRGFDEVFDPFGFQTDAEQVAAYDPALRWVLHAARAALHEAGRDGPLARTGLILGNLGFPSRGLAAYAERVWL